MPFFIGEPCIDVMDRSCVDECPVDCIYEGGRKVYINAKECIDCGACEPVCPVGAIFSDLKAPEEQIEHIHDNASFFDTVLPGREVPIGTPGGAHDMGPVGVDTELVATK